MRSATDDGTPVYWRGGCAYITPDTTAPPEMALPDVIATLTRSLANWQTKTAGCAYFKINLDEPAESETLLDGKNILKFRMGKWCHPADPSKKMEEVCYSPQAAAITTVFYNNAKDKPENYASVLDADIELNTIHYTFVNHPSTVTARNGTQLSDLENTLTHELGHFMGLDHTCWDRTSMRHPVNEFGEPIPECPDVIAHRVSDDLYNKITTSTMFNYASPGETAKRSPEAVDIEAVCKIYPIANDPMQCYRIGEGSGGCSCAVGGRAPAAGLLALLGAAAALLLLRRRR